MQISRINCCDGQNSKKQNFRGFTDRASEKICSTFRAPDALVLHAMTKKGPMIDFNPESKLFFIVGRLDEKGKQYTSSVNLDKLKDLVRVSHTYLQLPFSK